MGWRRSMFRGQSVWIEVDAAGEPVVDGNRVPMRYSDKPGAKVYRAGASNLGAPTGPLVELEGGVSADAAKEGGRRAGGGRGRGFGKAGTRTAGQTQAARQAARELLDGLEEGTVVAFTDGACRGNPGPAGSGARLELPDGRRLEGALSLGRATNNVAELEAVGLALDLLDRAGVDAEATVALLTDSDYTHGVLVRGWKAKANRDRILALRERLQARPGITLHWVAGHAGIEGNEAADRLANAGVEGQTFVVGG